MTLRQAYDDWSQQTQNIKLYRRTRQFFQKAWFTLPTNKPCAYYTMDVLGKALSETREVVSSKASAASVMVQVLSWANFAEPDVNPAPNFTHNDLMEYTKGPLADLSRITPSGLVATKPVPSGSRAEDGDNTDKQEDDTDKSGDDTDKDMEENTKNKECRPSRAVVQIDPDTLEAVMSWPSISRAETELGIKNIGRCASLLCKAGGFYWSDAANADTFRERFAAKQAQKTTGAKKKSSSTSAKAKPEPSQSLAPPDEQDRPSNRTPAERALEVFSDDELQDELGRRGWFGELTRQQVAVIGSNGRNG